MSRYLIDHEDFEGDNGPFTCSSYMGYSATDKINGTYFLRGGNAPVANDAIAEYGAFSNNTGSRRGLRIQVAMQYKTVSMPSGGTLNVFKALDSTYGKTFALEITTGVNYLKFNGTAGSSTALSSTAHTIRLDYREERNAGVHALVYLDGNVEIDYRSSTGALGDFYHIILGVSAANKCAWRAVWDDITVVQAVDPY